MGKHKPPKTVRYWNQLQDKPELMLAYGIVFKAISDFFAIKHNRLVETPEHNLKELENFFNSKYFYFLCHLDGNIVWNEINRAYRAGKDFSGDEIIRAIKP